MKLDNIQFLCDTIDNGILLLNKDFQVQFWNKWLESRTNIKADEIINKNLYDFFPNLEYKRLKRKIDTSLKLNIATYYNTEVNKYLLDIKLNKVTNKVFDNMQQAVTITPYNLEEGVVILYIYDNTLLFENAYTLKKAKESLEIKNNEIDLLLNTTMEAVIVYENEKCKYTNNTALELFEYENKNDFAKKSLHELVDYQYISMIKSQNETPFEVKMIKQNKEVFDALVQIKDKEIDNKRLKVLTVIDLTQIKTKDKILADQSKMAVLGEMFGNIVHQWRQPLSAICTITSGLQFQRQRNIKNEELLDKNLDDIVNLTTHLSETINDFRSFMLKEKSKSKFMIKDNIDKTINILNELLKAKGIEIIIDYEDNYELESYSNELTQALLNIINNAKDALEEIKTNKKYIFVKTFKDKDNGYIEIKDNALGINENIINDIFKPYFTTKGEELGTGLGLYMTQQIIEISMKSKIKVSNCTYNYKEQSYKGACFTIKIPFLQT